MQYTGISQSAIREMALCTELSHENVINLAETILESKCIYMIFDYADHDLLQLIHWHTQVQRTPMPGHMLNSVIFQLLSGLLYLHQNWVMHRDLKPANIMVTAAGQIKIGDLGLARLFNKPLQPLYNGDKVVVTIWYRAPELLLGTRHYTPAIDLWAVGCIFAELMSLRPLFKGDEVKQEPKKPPPFQASQVIKIAEILGLPKKADWSLVTAMPDYAQLAVLTNTNSHLARPIGLDKWWDALVKKNNYASSSEHTNDTGPAPHRDGLLLLKELLVFDPLKRVNAETALKHAYFKHDESGIDRTPLRNCFQSMNYQYPVRKVSSEYTDMDMDTVAQSGTKRAAGLDDRVVKRHKDE